MPNVYKMSENVYRVEFFNLSVTWNKEIDGSLHGHYEVFINRTTGKFLVYKMGEFGSLSWYPENKGLLFENEKISKKNLAWLEERTLDELAHAATYDEYITVRRGARNIIFDYPYHVFADLHGTRIGKMAVELLEQKSEVCDG